MIKNVNFPCGFVQVGNRHCFKESCSYKCVKKKSQQFPRGVLIFSRDCNYNKIRFGSFVSRLKGHLHFQKMIYIKDIKRLKRHKRSLTTGRESWAWREVQCSTSPSWSRFCCLQKGQVNVWRFGTELQEQETKQCVCQSRWRIQNKWVKLI